MMRRLLTPLLWGLFLLTAAGCQPFISENAGPAPVKGLLDLSEWDFTAEGPVSLKGEWEFYNHRFIGSRGDPRGRPGYLPMTSPWNGLRAAPDEPPLTGMGYGTYRLRITGLPVSPPLSLKVMEMCSSYRLYYNGKLLGSNGSPATSAEENRAAYIPQVIDLPPEREGEILLEIANFEHNVGGGWGKILLGESSQLHRLRANNLAVELFIAGALFVMAGYHLVLFILRRKNLPPLFFSSFCFLISLRTLITGERFLNYLLSDVPWALFLLLEYLTFYLAIPSFILFFKHLYPREFKPLVVKIFISLSLAFSFFTLVTPAALYTRALYFFQILTLAAGIYVVGVLLLAIHRGREGTRLFLVLFLLIMTAGINDMLHSNGIINTMILAPSGFFVFIFGQALILAQRFTGALEQSEQYSREISQLNATLERKVEERTKTLREMAHKDSMTHLLNHARVIEKLEELMKISSRYDRPLSVIMLDLDHFKRVNDSYGHQRGDDVLQSTADIIRRSLREMDVAGRYGGEEFLICLPETSLKAAETAAERIRAAVEQSAEAWEDINKITISGGLTEVKKGEIPADVIERADTLLYLAKEKGRNRIEVTQD